ncbi:MAG: T9SS type A sorting domain-containing protein [Bacteroidota bacterium]
MSLILYIICRIFVQIKEIKPMKLRQLHIILSNQSQLMLGLRLALAGLIFLLGAISGANGQGFEKVFGGNSADFGEDIITTDNGGYILTGFSESFGDDGDLDVYVIRTDVDGKVMWERTYDEGFTSHGYAIIAVEDGGFIIAGDSKASPTTKARAYLLKIDENGQLLWSKVYGDEEREHKLLDIVATPTGYLMVGRSETVDEEINQRDTDVYAIAVDEEGELIWERTYGDDQKQEALAVTAYDETYIIAGKTVSEQTESTDALLIRIDSDGEIQWQQAYGAGETDIAYAVLTTNTDEIVFAGSTGFNNYLTKLDGTGEVIWSKSFGGVLGDEAHDMIALPTGEIVIAGISERDAINIDLSLTQVNSDGNIIWERFLGSNTDTEIAPALTETDFGYALVSSTGEFEFDLIPDTYLVTTDREGNLNSTYIRGEVFSDIDNNCQSTIISDEPLVGWLVKAEGETGTYFSTTNEMGEYEMLVDTGRYNVSVLTKNDYWQPCIDDYNINLNQLYDTLTLNFPVDAGIVCPFLQVDIAAASLSNCDDVTYTVEYCNTGTAAAFDAYVEVTIGDLVAINSTSIPVNGNVDATYRFEVGNIALGECGTFTINAIIDCEGFITGQAHQVSAHIYPDEYCSEPDEDWDGSSVALKGACTTDSIKFELKNIGTNPMEDSLQYFVVEDIIILLKDSFKLEASESFPVSFPANGSTFRMIAAQAKGHPGQSYPTIVVEGCASEDGEAISTGFVTAFPEDENDPFISIDIIENNEFTEATQMRGYPRGYGEEKMIPPTTDLEYQVRFQNLTDDTITSVIIRDTLSPLLDLATIQPGASSHPYFFEVYGNGVLKFTFFDLQLPPQNGSSDTNESVGFVSFKVAQQADNPPNAMIENRAAVYLGYDAQRLTNIVLHTVGEEDLTEYVEISTSTSEVFVPGVAVNIYPNPFVESATIELEGISIHNGTFEILDITGRVVRTQRFSGNQVTVQRADLTSGLYFYQLSGDGRRINNGKIFVQ